MTSQVFMKGVTQFMFVYSVKSSKLKLASVAIAAALAIFALIYLVYNNRAPAANDGAISLKASNAAERTAFLSQFGWNVSEDPIEVAEVIIPTEFDEAYAKYNSVQQSGGFDLLPYSSMRAKRWTYEVLNYPGYEDRKGLVQANLLVYEGRVIGGDICSTELGGFLQGFDFPVPATTAAPASTTTVPAASDKTTAP